MTPRAPKLLVALATVTSLGGCPPDRSDELQCGVTPADALVACPSEQALVTHLRERWGLHARADISARCVPGRFGGAGWIVHAIARDGASVAGAVFVLQPSCGALTDAALRPGAPRDATYEAIDLDGDGVDEILARRTTNGADGAETTLEALRVAGGRLRHAGKIRIAYDGGDPDAPDLPDRPALRCTGDVRYINRPEGGFFVEIEATRSRASESCLADGTHRFELTLRGLARRRSD